MRTLTLAFGLPFVELLASHWVIGINFNGPFEVKIGVVEIVDLAVLIAETPVRASDVGQEIGSVVKMGQRIIVAPQCC